MTSTSSTTTPAADSTDADETATGLYLELPGGRALVDSVYLGHLIGMSDRWVRQETQLGRIPCRRFGDRSRYLLPDDLDAFLASTADPGRR